jgi:L-serine dehydratase
VISVFDLFKIGIGPSSSHTVGPMRAARLFAAGLAEAGLLGEVASVRAELFGSLGATGRGHGSDKAVLLGLAGDEPETVDTDSADERAALMGAQGSVALLGGTPVAVEVVLHRRRTLPLHPNGMLFTALDATGATLRERTYYSVGGGFVVDARTGALTSDETPVPHPFRTGAELLRQADARECSIADVMLANELVHRDEERVRADLLRIWATMRDCVARGCDRDGTLPGSLKVRRRAAELYRTLAAEESPPGAAGRTTFTDPMHAMDWVTLWALAVNEENAAGGRVVTAPTNGAAGIIPAVLHYYVTFVPGADDEGVLRFLLTAGAIGVLFKENASISGAEVGCQGEVGSACSMAAAGLVEALGGTPAQVENAAEIAMEHNLGLTCDPVGGLVQIPCIERNAVASVKAITAARLALRGDGAHHVSLDKVIKTMRETGADMKIKYKETARGGLAVNVIEC